MYKTQKYILKELNHLLDAQLFSRQMAQWITPKEVQKLSYFGNSILQSEKANREWTTYQSDSQY